MKGHEHKANMVELQSMANEDSSQASDKESGVCDVEKEV